MTANRPKVGVGVIVIRDNKVLLGKRVNAHGNHTYNFPAVI
jgi:8-oxo-dGTP diphosphatase